MDILVVSGAELLPYAAFIGVALLVAEFFLPTKGIIGVIGAMLFVIGTIAMAFHPDPAIRISIAMCITLNLIVLGTSIGLFYMTWRGYTASNTDSFDLKNKTAKVIDWNHDFKRVEIDGAIWLAETHDLTPLLPGQNVRILSQNNLTLTVEPAGDHS